MSDVTIKVIKQLTQRVVVNEGKAGAAGPPIVDTGSYGSPSSITTAIAIPTSQRARVFVQGSPGAVVDPVLGSGAGTQELHLMGVSNANTVELNSAANLLLSGKIILKQNSYLILHWIAGLNKWLEAARNEL